MRTLLITGPGGSGRTTVAAATALAAARAGARVLLLGTDRTDTLGAVLGTPVGTAPGEVAEGLTARRVDAGEDFRADLAALQDRAASALDLLGASRLDPEAFGPLPGAEELSVLRALRDAALSPAHDLLVVDLPPAERALALFALPEDLRRALRGLLPPERRAARALRPVLGRLAGVPMPAEWLYGTAARWDTALGAVEAVLADRRTTVRLVAEPGPAGAAAVRTAGLGLALRGLRTDVLVAGRVLPEGVEDSWLAGPVAQQRKTLDEWRQTYDVRPVAHLGRDPRGPDDLTALAVPGVPVAPGASASAAPPASGGAAGPATAGWPVTDRLADDGVLVWHIPLPGARREELDLVRHGDQIAVTAGPFRRTVPLPSALRRCTVDGAALREDELRIRFRPDPRLWPRTP
ncbi:ArsA family ATPase [Streptomyces prasinopilosus]|uniref:Arsenite-transporting ATPase n=1 Tax=Streptomyces prasinopilosus TaxID=67344 RepID=A0A1G6JW05_9ACTN|nr:ArsA-related P-loop ATPase [Streptomyces prasinopilosus]SDC22894.1 arsenite-transporting ATPase [Streptomyces prasinopilosus]